MSQKSELQSGNWYRRKNLFDPKKIKESTISFPDRIKLLFKKRLLSVDSENDFTTVTFYKRMNGMIYVLKVVRRKNPAFAKEKS